MAADQSLIQASLIEARSRRGIDKTPFYEAQLKSITQATTSIIDYIDNKEKLKEKGFNDIAGNIEEMLRKLSSSNEQLGGMHDANVAKLKQLKEQYLSVYGDADAEKQVMFEIEQVAAEINGLAAGFSKYGEAYTNGTINVSASNVEFYDYFNNIWDKDGDYSNLTFQWNGNKLEVSVDNKGFKKVTDLFDGIHLIDDKPRNDLGVLGGKFETQGTKNNNKSFDDYRGAGLESVGKLIDTKNKFANLTGSSFQGEISYEEALATLFDEDPSNDNALISGILKDLKLLDSIQNKTILFDSLTDVNAENFDFETAKDIAKQFYTDGYLKSKFTDGRTELNNALKVQGDETGYYLIGKQSVSKRAVNYAINLLNSNQDFPQQQFTDGTLYKRENGKYYLRETVVKDGEIVYKEDQVTPKTEWVVKTKDEVASKLGILRYDLGYKGEQVSSGGNKGKGSTSNLQLSDEDKSALNIPEQYRIFDNGEFKDVRKGGINWTELSDEDYKKWISWNNEKIKQ